MPLHLIALLDDALGPCPHALVGWLSQKTCNEIHEYAIVCLCIIYKLNHGTIYSFQDTQWMLIALGLIPLILTGLHRHE
jgi:hypothetical protein